MSARIAAAGKVLFGQSYFLRFDPKLFAAMQPYPPLGTLYAASFIRSRGYDVALFDAMLADSETEWDLALQRHQPTIAVLYEDNFNYLSKMCLLRMRDAAFTMIGLARKRGCLVIVAGSDATDHAQAYLDAGAQYVLVGEGEETLGELLDHLHGKPAAPPAEDILGLAYISGDELRVNPRRPDLKDLDALPFPAWDLVDIQRYRAVWVEHHGYYSMNVATSRGCPYHCNWCAKPIWGQRYHVRSAENVAAEFAWLKQTYAPDHIWVVDDIFGLIPGWMEQFADLVEQKDARLPFKSLQRVDLILKGNTIDALRRAGAERIWMGAESGSQKILDAMEKGTQVENIYEAARRLHAAGIKVGFFLQFGYPGETRQDVEKTLQMVRDCHPDDIGMSVSYPLPGTRFFSAVQHELGSKQNWQDSEDLAMLYHGPFSTAFYRWLHRVLHREFRAQRAWDQMLPALRQPLTLRRRHLKLARSVLYAKLALPILRLELERRARAPHQGLINLVPVEAATE
ncbi:MAG TPA: radical SAM protein [Chloroflexota bacterium]|jgi:anaerobic magnesium-protoporphyrin IX monomethyl ester cyclase|nr:radical SAM protein [Chloroflexota bacterium]